MDVAWLQAVQAVPRNAESQGTLGALSDVLLSATTPVCALMMPAVSRFVFYTNPCHIACSSSPWGQCPYGSTVGVMTLSLPGFRVMAGSSLCLQSLSFASVCWAGTDLSELQGNLEVSNQHITGIEKTKKFC